MDKYINTRDFVMAIYWEHDNEVWEIGPEECDELMDNAVEAAPVIRAIWIPRPDIGDCTYECSHCGKIYDAYCDDDRAFCARCGAMMEENGEEENE